MNNFKQIELAQNLFISEGMSASSISLQLGISRRTVYYWAKHFRWQEKREKERRDAEILNKKLSDDMLLMADKLANKIAKDIDNGKQLSQNDAFLFMNLIKLNPNLKKYENLVHAGKEPKKEDKKFIAPELVFQIEKEVFGLHQDKEFEG